MTPEHTHEFVTFEEALSGNGEIPDGLLRRHNLVLDRTLELTGGINRTVKDGDLLEAYKSMDGRYELFRYMRGTQTYRWSLKYRVDSE